MVERGGSVGASNQCASTKSTPVGDHSTGRAELISVVVIDVVVVVVLVLVSSDRTTTAHDSFDDTWEWEREQHSIPGQGGSSSSINGGLWYEYG